MFVGIIVDIENYGVVYIKEQYGCVLERQFLGVFNIYQVCRYFVIVLVNDIEKYIEQGVDDENNVYVF